jgi:hypothetical protein
MSSHRKRAGQSTRDMADKRYKSRVRFVLIAAGVVLLIFVLVSRSTALGIGGFGVLGLLFLARFIMEYMETRAGRMVKEERRAIRGAKAEEKIGAILDSLGENYLGIHDVTSPHGNIDHIVIGKENGVFLIETKAHGGRVSVANGRLLVNEHEPEKDFIVQVLKNTYWLRDRILSVINVEVWITPALVFTNAFVERTAPIKGVVIINRKYLPNILQRPNPKARNSLVWERRKEISEALQSS